MSIGSGVPYNEYIGNGVTVVFAYGFTLLDADDLIVTIDGVATSAFTVSGLGVAAGGSVTFSSAPASGAAVLLRRVIQLVRTTDYQSNGDLLAETVNQDFDRVWLALQQTDASVGQSIRVPELGVLPELPIAASRAGRLLAFNAASGDPEASSVTETEIASAVAAAYAAGSTADAVTYLADGTGATPRSVQEKMREQWLTPFDFGAIADGTSHPLSSVYATLAAAQVDYPFATSLTQQIDWCATWAAYLSVTEQGTFLGGPYLAGPTIFFPLAQYYFDTGTFHWKKRITLIGDGSGKAYGDGAILMWAADTTGMVFHARYTDSTAPSTAGVGADASVVRGLAFYSAGGASTDKPAIWMRVRVAVENCYIENFPGDGIQVIATAPTAWSAAVTYALGDNAIGGSTYYRSIQAGNLNHAVTDPAWWAVGVSETAGNANLWSVTGGRVNDCTGDGLYVVGSDANAGMCLGLDSSSNGGWGFNDESFLGNTYLACHTASNTTGPYRSTNANARNIFIGCYSEGGQPDSHVVGPSQIVGGLHAAGSAFGFSSGSTGGFLDMDLAGAVFRNAHLVPSKGLNFDTSKITRSSDADTLDAYTESISHTPTSSGITTTGTITYSWQGTRVGNRVDFVITVGVSGGTNAFTAGSSYVTLPAALAPTLGGACCATTTVADQVGICHISTTGSGRVYLPTWVASNKTVIISGTFFISTTAA